MKKTLTTLLALAATVAVGTAASAADKLMVSGSILLIAVAIDALSKRSTGGR